MIELILFHGLKSLILPPGGLLLLWLLGLLLLRRSPLAGRLLLWGGLVLAYLAATPLVSGQLLQQLQSYPALDAAAIDNSPAQAIVVLGSERYRDAPEYGSDTVGKRTLVRIRYAAHLHRETGLPILVSGGHVLRADGESLARTMAASLAADFGITEVWLEERSRNTAENARFSHSLLREQGIERVFLVTHAFHMPRAVQAFARTGLEVTPAPTHFYLPRERNVVLGLLPSAGAAYGTYLALHEQGGRLWYRLRHGSTGE
jgi:uncharacterized SAM-binding protein YcdF (DUF218 family)